MRSSSPTPDLTGRRLDRHQLARHRSALSGCAIAGLFGALWSVGAATSLQLYSTGASIAVGVVGVLLGLGLAVGSLRFRAGLAHSAAAPSSEPSSVRSAEPPSARSVPQGTGRMFGTRRYRITVTGELLLIVAGGAILDRLGLSSYAVIWVAAVVGVHFLVFGRLFRAGFYLVGAVLIAGAVAGLVLALALSGPTAGVILTSLVAALDLIGAAAIGLRAVVRAVGR